MKITKIYQGVYEARADGKAVRISKNSRCGWVLTGDLRAELGRMMRAFGTLSEAKDAAAMHLSAN